MEERRRSSDNDTVGTESIDSLLGQLDGSSEVSLPDVAARNQSQRKDDWGGLDGSNDIVELSGSTVEVNVEAGDGELSNDLDVGVEAGEVGGEQDLGRDGSKLGVSRDKLLLESRGNIEDEDGLVNLDPLDTSCLEGRQESVVDGEELGKERDGLEARLRVFGSLAEDKERDGAEDDWACNDTSSLGLFILFESFVEVELELGLVRKFGDNVVVVGVKPGSP